MNTEARKEERKLCTHTASLKQEARTQPENKKPEHSQKTEARTSQKTEAVATKRGRAGPAETAPPPPRVEKASRAAAPGGRGRRTGGGDPHTRPQL